MAFHVYILEACDASKAGYKPTYVGATVDVARRLRQHNGELAGGARRTTARCAPRPKPGGAEGSPQTWRVACTVGGFRTWSEALKFEFALRRVGARRVRRWDLDGRRRALEVLLGMERWSSTSPPSADVPLSVQWCDALATRRR